MIRFDRLEAVAFDYYGTLVDIQKPFERIREWFDQFLQSSGRYTPALSDAFFMRFSRERARLACSPAFLPGYEILAESYAAACQRYHLLADRCGFNLLICDLFARPRAYDGAKELVEWLHARYRVGLITNADNGILRQSIRRQGFAFDFIVTSEDARCCKPAPDIFRRALGQLGLPPDRLLMIGDSLSEDILAARRCGIPALFLNRHGQPADVPMATGLAQLRDMLESALPPEKPHV